MPGIGRRRRIATPQLFGKLRYDPTPAQPPLPTPENLPFQPSSGNHTSNRICESGVGAIIPATRQKGGRLPIAFVVPGGVNEPVVTGSAERIVVFASLCSANRAQPAPGGVCAYRDDDIAEAIRTMAAKTGGADFMDRILLVARGCVKCRDRSATAGQRMTSGLTRIHGCHGSTRSMPTGWSHRAERGRSYEQGENLMSATESLPRSSNPRPFIRPDAGPPAWRATSEHVQVFFDLRDP